MLNSIFRTNDKTQSINFGIKVFVIENEEADIIYAETKTLVEFSLT